ncbi:DDT domain-containing protein DDR4-like [Melia azedarach]|uniref:DDT domain-containing protein DDR4-like n=1 Tax=Melia azedarach TaxID=155640 RepID=A0ACC1XBB9_MELAZ|nr:DDT domain-containing protein DDR4-like [Melia azedarach]
MVGARRKTATSSRATVGDKNVAVNKDSVIVPDESSSETEVKKLRGRWELASVLNFLNVFEPVIGSDLKLTADEIEIGLITPNKSNAQLHIKLLKGIPPVSKSLNSSDAWVTVLCKKLALWWPWVAEGEIPLTAANGKEIFQYKELDPTCRLLILKALCEIRADQDDTVSYINAALKNKTQVSCFRKDKIGKDGHGTSYWYDGSTIIGYRLYREVNKSGVKTKTKGKACLNLPPSCFQWETIATNLEEFCEVVDELSSSNVVAETAVGKTIANDAVPVVEKFHKKKQRSLKRKQREEMLLLNGFGNSYAVGLTRSCRSRRPISYTFDEYDRAIDEAIALTKRSKSTKEQRIGKKHIEQGKNASNGMRTSSEDSFGSSDKERNKLGKRKDSTTLSVQKPLGLRWSPRLAGGSRHHVLETKNLGTKNRLRQRPTHNSALDSVVLDSDDEKSAEHTNCGILGHENLIIVADSDEVSDS